MGFYLTLWMIFLYKNYDLQYVTPYGCDNIRLPERFTGTIPRVIEDGHQHAVSIASQFVSTEARRVFSVSFVELALDPERKGLITNES